MDGWVSNWVAGWLKASKKNINLYTTLYTVHRITRKKMSVKTQSGRQPEEDRHGKTGHHVSATSHIT